jgi:putative SOS response-associated peptidase YedK
VKDLSKHKPLINARAKTLTEKASVKKALMNRRCLIPADSFYEWKSATGIKTPMNIHLKGNKLFAMAGQWGEWTSANG